jgi:uncharacterized membrane protein YeaQ/YmgE (transglycosylase-associated protein family)
MEAIWAVLSSPFICLGWIIVGAIAGALARRIMGAGNYPIFQDLILGILGAIVGGWLAGFVGGFVGVNFYARAAGLELVLINLVVATIGAAVLIFVRRTLTGRK